MSDSINLMFREAKIYKDMHNGQVHRFPTLLIVIVKFNEYLIIIARHESQSSGHRQKNFGNHVFASCPSSFPNAGHAPDHEFFPNFNSF